ncbi:UDP-N-acetylmuramoyl-tripeptide--D-alanyl-D-alanine ligase [Bifidobacterium sp. ESL0732]|uniref:UDP-N-acetylmuramoyl-tripeptide--D-alanyl-D- alanine ligase n=1 Tax=Bifidobacterium sp. ESL0732 TaxID=2983222 RepID=UPI0023F94CC9|nr:UDP-N-acetylmuramoyl-tripeptide--D-alanyl-D-alanine ligase [Bifidobacterium sp. ESL0732]WEV64934.1 UDP-N-acetylmuramoyl-tripeptide--D-alanyl-D-alanine ligase [Bifidobacterium sp. ESL0732]
MMPMTIEEIAQTVGGRIVSGPGYAVPDGAVATSVFSDSRQITNGSVFVAIKGEHVDGHDFVAGAGAKGAVAALVDHVVAGADGIAQIVVDDTVAALGHLAQHNIVRRRQSNKDFSVIGITGSVGKTTTKDLLRSLMDKLGETVAPVGSFNNDIGLPLTALKVGERTRFFVAEMGANHVGEIANLTRIVPPDLAVVLKVGVAHLGEFGSVERIAQAKSEIVQGLVPSGVTVLNADDKRVAAMTKFAPGDVLWFGLNGEAQPQSKKMTAANISVDTLDRPSFTLVAPNGEMAQVHLGIGGAHNVINALAAATVADYFGMPLTDIAEGLGDVKHISPHRMAVSLVDLGEGSGSFTLIDDSFNANPDSMRAGLDGLARWEAPDEPSEKKTQDKTDSTASKPKPYRVAVLGAMLELGDDELKLHRQIGAYAASLGLDEIIAVGNEIDKHFDDLAHALAQGAEGLQVTGDVSGGSASSEAAPADTVCDTTIASDGPQRTPVVVQWVHSAVDAERLVAQIARRHQDTVVLLKGSHFSGLSALAERWAGMEQKTQQEVEPKH